MSDILDSIKDDDGAAGVEVGVGKTDIVDNGS